MRAILRLFPLFRNRDITDETLHVYSGETASGKEAEFIDDKLPEERKIVRFFRIILATLYFVVVLYMLLVGKSLGALLTGLNS